MKKTYTQFFTGILTLLLGVVCVQSASAQYTITTADGTQYEILIGDPGQFEGEPVTATLELASSSCSPMTNASGSIVIADLEAGCTAAQIVDNAAAANVLAVIVCGIADARVNYDTDAAGSVTAGNAGDDFDTPLAVFGIGADCANLKVSVGTSATLELLVPECARVIPENAIWGMNGEGEFADGLGEWTVDNSNGWTYEPRGKLDRGAYNSNVNQADTPTLCNGAMVADASYGDNAGEPGNFLSGDCPSDNNVFCETRLTSPLIDLTGVEFQGLFLQFNQAVRQFNSEYFLLVSKDGGVTFSDTMQINQALDGSHNRNVVSIPITGVSTGDVLQFRLWYRGYYYYWAVDDFYLVSQELADMRLNTEGGIFFASHAANFETPSTQADIIPLLVDIENVGNVAATDVSVTATLSDDTGAILDETSLDFGTIEPGVVDQNRLFPETFDMPTTPGNYTLTYTLTSPGDENMSNNVYEAPIIINDGDFSKCDSEDARFVLNFDQQYKSAGASYHIVNGTSENGTQLYIEQLRFAASGSAANAVVGSITFAVYKWLDLDMDGVVDAFDGTGIPERELVYDSEDNGTSLTLFGGASPQLEDIIIDLGDARVPLEDNTNYLVVAHASAQVATESFLFLHADTEENTAYNYSGTRFAFGPGSSDGIIPNPNDPTTTTLGTISENPLNMTRGGCFLDLGTDSDSHTRQLRPINNFTSVCEMSITKVDGVNTEEINENIAVSVFPNPATNNVFVNLALENVSENVNLQLVDVQGRVVLTQNFANVKAEKLQLNVANLNTGVYVINIRTEEGFTSARFIKN